MIQVWYIHPIPYDWLILMVNVGIYLVTIHGSYGL